jgi:hypothetical protein
MTVIFVHVSFVVAVDVQDHYDGVTDAEVADNAALDADIGEWLTNDMTAVECSGYEVIADPGLIDIHASTPISNIFSITLGGTK